MKPDKVNSITFIAHFRSQGQNNQVLIEPKPSPRTLKMSCKQFCQWIKCPEAESSRKKLFTHLPFSPLLAVQCPSCLSICKQSFPTDNLENLLEIFRPGYISFFPYMGEQQAHGNELMVHLSVGRKHLVYTFISLQHNSLICKNKNIVPLSKGLLPFRVIFIGQ